MQGLKKRLKQLVDASGRDKQAKQTEQLEIWPEPSPEIRILLDAREAIDRAILILQGCKQKFPDDNFDRQLLAYLERSPAQDFTSREILQAVLGEIPERELFSRQCQLGIRMKKTGWRKSRKRKNGYLHWVYERPDQD